MTIAIGGWVLVLVTGGAPSIPNLVSTGLVVAGYDTAEACETARERAGRAATHRCVPALATVAR